MFASVLSLEAGYDEGKTIFDSKCTACHVSFVPPDKVQENFFEKNNTMLNLKAPSVNMIAFAIMDGSKHVGDKSDPEMQQIEIEEYLKDYIEKPNLSNSICDPNVVKFYEVMPSMKGQLSNKEYEDLASFFINYKKMRKKAKMSAPKKSIPIDTKKNKG